MLSLFAAMLVLAADAQPDNGLGLYGPLLNIGAVGVICVVLILFARSTVADLRKQRDDCQDRIEELQQASREQSAKQQDDMVALLNTVLPLVTQSSAVMTEAISEVRRTREGR